MASLSEAQLEQEVGDIVTRRRIVSDILEQGGEYRTSPSSAWYFGAMTVSYTTDDRIVARSPDGDVFHITIPKAPTKEAVERVEAQIIDVWEDWLAML